jgi:hypothetical protein
MRQVNLWAVFAALAPMVCSAQTVTNTSYVTSTGEKVLRIECTIPARPDDAWRLFTTANGLRQWAAPVVAIDLRVGGNILTNYDKSKSVHDPGSIQLHIINYLEDQMITLKVRLNETFPAKIRREDGNLQEIIQLQDLGNGSTRITSSMIGWGIGPEWDKAYQFFAAGNAWSYQQLASIY